MTALAARVRLEADPPRGFEELIGLIGALLAPLDAFEQALVRRKAGWDGVLMAPPVAMEAIEWYLEARRDDCDWLWVHHDPRRPADRLTPEGVRHICNVLAAKMRDQTLPPSPAPPCGSNRTAR